MSNWKSMIYIFEIFFFRIEGDLFKEIMAYMTDDYVGEVSINFGEFKGERPANIAANIYQIVL